jgi:hypothetical protein
MDTTSKNSRTTGGGWTVDLVKKVLAAGGKVTPFNTGYMKIFVRRPTLAPSSDGMNRFFQEGGPEYSSPGLVPMNIAVMAKG